MKRAVVIVAIAGLIAASYICALQVAASDRPSLTPGEQQRCLQATQESRSVAGQRATQGKQQKPKPVTITRKYKPPRAAMAARTAVTMGEIWNGTLELVNMDAATSSMPPAAAVSMASLGCSATLENVPIDAAQWWYDDPKVPDPDADPEWRGHYWHCRLTVSASGGTAQTRDYAVWFKDDWGMETNDIPSGYTVVMVPELTDDVSLSVSGLYLKRGRTASPPSDRQTMDFSDLDATDSWYADDTTTVTVTAGGLSSTGSLGYTPGQEVEIGSSYILAASMTCTWAQAANTTYARISNIQWGGTPVSLANLPLYNPGDPAGIPSVDISPWSRVWSTDDCWSVVNDSGAAMQRRTALGWNPGQSETVSLKWSAPKILTLTPIDGMFDKQGPSYDIEYTSTPITWTSTTEYEATKFSAPISVAEYPTNFEYEYEYKKLSGNTITVTVTDDWRTLNGEDVSNDGGAVTAAYNDQLCGILLCPLTATDCISDPHWQPGINITHRPSTDINDTEGQARRASWWLGGAGVTVDPTDNDKWQVAAGATAPAVSRSLRTRYWLRMERLAEWLDDPEAEHNADWPIMLKANLDIGETLDDADWWTEPEVVVASAGTSGVNGTYAEYGSAGGAQQYQKGNVYIRYNRDETRWEIVESGTVYYTCPTLTGTWVVSAGNSPAPDVSLTQYTEYGETACLIEDIWNWANYRYVQLGITAPKNGTLRMTVEYSVPSVADPCYTGFAYRFGDLADLFGGWEYSRADYTLSYDIPVVAGAGTYLVDLVESVERIVPRASRRIQVVSSITIDLLANNTVAAEDWELTSLALVEDTGEPGRAEPDTHFVARFKPSWSWLDPNYRDDSEDAVHAPMNWFGFGGIIDGLDCLEIDYGYNTSFGQTGKERKLLYIQYAQHNPLSEATGLIHSAKSLGRWRNELSWQEGFDITWPGTDPLLQAENKDAYDGQVDGSMYWWDLAQSDEETDWTDTSIALCAGSYTMASGVAYDVRFHKYPRGALHGIALSDGLVLRNEPGVEVWGQDGIGTGTWTLLDTLTTDEHGRFRYDECREKDWAYRVAGYATIWYVVNRSYTTVLVTIPPATSGGQAVAMFAHPAGRVIWTVWIDGDDIKAAETLTGKVTLGTVRTIDTSGDYDSVYAGTDGNTVYVDGRRTADHKLCRWYSDDYGETWTGPAVIS